MIANNALVLTVNNCVEINFNYMDQLYNAFSKFTQKNINRSRSSLNNTLNKEVVPG